MQHQAGMLEKGNQEHFFHQSWRPDTAPKAAVCLVHGYGEHSGRYPNLVPELVARGMAVWAFDNRGHGRSYGARGHVDRWDDIRGDTGAFVEKVRQSEPGVPLFIMGHSMGGLIVLDYVIHNPEGLSGVVVSGPALSLAAASKVLLAASQVLSAVWPGFSMNTKLDAGAVSRDPQVVRTYLADPLVHSRGSARLGTEMGKAMELVKARAGEIKLPILVIHGGDDRLVAPETSQALFESLTSPDKKRIEYPGYFHETHNDMGWQQPVSDVAGWIEGHI